MLRNMRRQFIDDLQKIGFLPHVGKTASQGRTRDRRRNSSSTDDPDGLGAFNEQAKNRGLITAVLVRPPIYSLSHLSHAARISDRIFVVQVAGLYPNVLLASDTLFDRFGNPELRTIDDHEVCCACNVQQDAQAQHNRSTAIVSKVKIHPTSVNFKAAEKGKKLGRLMIFHEKVRTTQVYIRDCTPISPYPVLLFGGTLDVYHRQGVRHTLLSR